MTPERGTETFAEVTLELDSWRWSGRASGCARARRLGKDRKEVVVHFRPVPHLPFDTRRGPAQPAALRPRAGRPQPRADRHRPRVEFSLVPLNLRARHEPAELPPYGRILLDVLNGAQACRSAPTKPRRHGGSSPPSWTPGRTTSRRWRSTRPGPAARRAGEPTGSGVRLGRRGGAAALVVTDQVHHRVDERQVGERLGEVSQVAAGMRVDLLGV